ncbi:MAG: zinc ribbon domain-containing protein [Clostridiales bacterium]|nr:zinc ribbon domain-containing protein [Clostridiales bacterium]
MYCSKCGKEIHDDAEICVHCGCRVKPAPFISSADETKLARFLLTFFLGFIGSIIINHTSLKPNGWKSRTLAYFFLGIITFEIYPLVASICNFSFDENKPSNIGYEKEQ